MMTILILLGVKCILLKNINHGNAYISNKDELYIHSEVDLDNVDEITSTRMTVVCCC